MVIVSPWPRLREAYDWIFESSDEPGYDQAKAILQSIQNDNEYAEIPELSELIDELNVLQQQTDESEALGIPGAVLELHWMDYHEEFEKVMEQVF